MTMVIDGASAEGRFFMSYYCHGGMGWDGTEAVSCCFFRFLVGVSQCNLNYH